jgi:hypothetical protein|tara:strand:+ start:4492 stop:5070 length:579 start_codon:yes stop_codon:yes gene_type:complete
MDTFWLYFKQGLFHVLDWQAYDHILFLIVLTVPYLFSNWKRLLTLVTVFTVGHTLALALAAYGVITVKSSWIELLIPITILVTALFNVFTAGKSAKSGKVGIYVITTLFFGLIHGLGFSTYFNMMTTNTSNKLLPLIEFTLGIEVAQIAIVILVLIASFLGQSLLRFSLRDWVMVISAVVIGMVIPMLVGAM